MTSESYPLSRVRAVAFTIAFVQFIGMLEGTIISTALPDMAGDFGVIPSEMGISITAYLLVVAAFLPASAWLADRFGTRKVLMIAIAGFGLSSLLCAMSESLGFFVAARIFQALCSSLMAPIGNLILLRITPRKQLVQMMAISTTPALIAPVIGPPIGGFLTEAAGWPSIFYINIPLAALGIITIGKLIPEFKGTTIRPFDRKGFLLMGGALACIVYAFDRIGAHPGQWLQPALLIVTGAFMGLMAYRHLSHSPTPLFPLASLSVPTFYSITYGAGFLMRLPFAGQALLLPLYFQVGFGMSPASAGLLLLANNLGDLMLKPFAGAAVRAWTFRNSLTYGTMAMMAGMGATAFLSPNMPLWLLMAAMIAVGMSRSISFTAMVSLAFADVKSEDLAGATVLNTIGYALSAAIGISLGALLVNAAPFGADVLTNYRFAILGLTILGILSIPLFARMPRDTGAEVSGHRTGESGGFSQMH